MPPKGSFTANLPEYVERGADGNVRCLACNPTDYGPLGGWIKRSSLARHLGSAAHADSIEFYAARRVSEAAASLQRNTTVALKASNSHTDDSGGFWGATKARWTADDLQHLDSNGVSQADYAGAQFSAGGTIGSGQSAEQGPNYLELHFEEEE